MRDPDFYLSADMRLVELQRKALGLEPAERADWESRGAVDGPSIPEFTPEVHESAVVNVILSATPDSGVIPGAIVTLALSVANEGAVPARGVTVGVPLPGGAAYRAGSFVRDGGPAYDEFAERFFGAGIAIGDIPAKSRVTFLWKIGVRIGERDLVVAPQVAVIQGAAIGGVPLSISRTTSAARPMPVQKHAPAAPARIEPQSLPVAIVPFYELEPDEEAAFVAGEAAIAQPEPIVPKAEPIIVPKAEPVVVPEPAVEVKPKPAPAREALVLLGSFDRTTLSFFDRTFSGSKPAALLQHCIFASALACGRDYTTGEDTAGLREHFDAQSQILHRIVLHQKLGKKEPVGEYAGQLRTHVAGLASASLGAPALTSDRDRLILEVEISAPSRAVLTSIEAESARWDFVKARQLTLALAAQRVVGDVGDAAMRTTLEHALRAYAQATMTSLQRLFVRIRIDRTTGVLFLADPALDAKAIEVLDAFRPFFGSPPS